MISRLTNCCELPSEEFAPLEEKISSTMTRMFRKPENGGNPFLFAFSAPKAHLLVRELRGQTIDTAATDGRNFYWNPEFLAKLSRDEVLVVMYHEVYHVVLCHRTRIEQAEYPILRNIAMDYFCNSLIEKEMVENKSPVHLWGGTLGSPMTLADFLKILAAGGKGDDGKNHIFVDQSVLATSPEEVYDLMIKALPPGSDGGGKGNGKPSPGDEPGVPGNSLDTHIEDDGMTPAEVQAEIMKAAETCKAMRGTLPGAIADLLGELEKPSLTFRDLIRNALRRKATEAGMQNDWKRFRKRWIAAKPSQYLPKRHSFKPRWIAMLDTSGSMAQDDLIYGVSQLQTLGNTEGLVVPVDTTPYWDNATKVQNAAGLAKVQAKGRGGTDFVKFFEELPAKAGLDWDCIVVITDGDFGSLSKALAPRGVDVVWVITNDRGITPPFGRVAPLRVRRM